MGTEAAAAKQALRSALLDKGSLSIVNSGLADGLERQSVRNEELLLSASALEAELAAATAEVAQQRGLLQSVGTETMNMRQVSSHLIEQPQPYAAVCSHQALRIRLRECRRQSRLCACSWV